MARAPQSSPAVRRHLEALETLAERLGVRVQVEPMTGPVHGAGGLCKVRGEYRVIVDRRLPPREKVGVLARALARFDLSRHQVPPELQALLEPIARGAPARADHTG